MRKFFKPNKARLLLFAVFMLIFIVGRIQTWAFSGKELNIPKPFLYDFLAPLGFVWLIWVFLLYPLDLLSKLLISIGGYDSDFIMREPYPLFELINVVYFYFLSCLFVFGWDKLRIRK